MIGKCYHIQRRTFPFFFSFVWSSRYIFLFLVITFRCKNHWKAAYIRQETWSRRKKQQRLLQFFANKAVSFLNTLMEYLFFPSSIMVFLNTNWMTLMIIKLCTIQCFCIFMFVCMGVSVIALLIRICLKPRNSILTQMTRLEYVTR